MAAQARRVDAALGLVFLLAHKGLHDGVLPLCVFLGGNYYLYSALKGKRRSVNACGQGGQWLAPTTWAFAVAALVLTTRVEGEGAVSLPGWDALCAAPEGAEGGAGTCVQGATAGEWPRCALYLPVLKTLCFPGFARRPHNISHSDTQMRFRSPC